MPRANRYLLDGRTCHLTHRCHNRSFLFRFAKDRSEYCRRLRLAVREFHVSLFAYCITSNHVHLLVHAADVERISAMMQKLEGEFAEHYNLRKRRTGAFWGGRFHGTMIDGGEYLWNCMRYIDLNMVRAGAVCHPGDWRWCGYRELLGERQRYRLLDIPALLALLGEPTHGSFARNYHASIGASLDTVGRRREPEWTESIAVGGEAFVRRIEEETANRTKLEVSRSETGAWLLRESPPSYGSVLGPKKQPKAVSGGVKQT